MRPSRTVVFWIVAAGFAAFLAYSSLNRQKVSCEVCMNFNGERRCASASGPDEDAAIKTATTTACGPLASGMTETLACERTPPASTVCGE